MKLIEIYRESNDSVQERHDGAISAAFRKQRESAGKLDMKGVGDAIMDYVNLVVDGTKPRRSVTILGKTYNL